MQPSPAVSIGCGGSAATCSGVHVTSVSYLLAAVAVQKNRLPWHHAVHVRVFHACVSSVMVISCLGHPIFPELTAGRSGAHPVPATRSTTAHRARPTAKRLLRDDGRVNRGMAATQVRSALVLRAADPRLRDGRSIVPMPSGPNLEQWWLPPSVPGSANRAVELSTEPAPLAS